MHWHFARKQPIIESLSRPAFSWLQGHSRHAYYISVLNSSLSQERPTKDLHWPTVCVFLPCFKVLDETCQCSASRQMDLIVIMGGQVATNCRQASQSVSHVIRHPGGEYPNSATASITLEGSVYPTLHHTHLPSVASSSADSFSCICNL